MAIVELTEDNFEEIISRNDLVVVDFWATWCAAMPYIHADIRDHIGEVPRHRVRQG